MAARFFLSSAAEKDIAEISGHIAVDSVDAALRMVDRFTDRFELIAKQPDIGERYDHPRCELRRHSVGSYLLFYQPIEEGVLIIRVLHGARQYKDLI